MTAALYIGGVVHARTRPVRHRLQYRMLNLLLDLDDLPELSRTMRLFGHNRAALFSFHDIDHGDGTGSLRNQIESALRHAGLDPGGGRILVLCMPRVLGFVFNPLTVYFCYDSDNAPRAMLYEVNNTFGQRHTYLIPAGGTDGVIRQSCEKQFYVSPFMDMALTYRFRITPPQETMSLAVEVADAAGPLLFAAFTGRRHALTDGALLRAFLSHALQASRVRGGIHWEALKLWRKGMRPRPRPAPPAKPMTIAAPGNRP
jgi:uncharacterized protein